MGLYMAIYSVIKMKLQGGCQMKICERPGCGKEVKPKRAWMTWQKYCSGKCKNAETARRYWKKKLAEVKK